MDTGGCHEISRLSFAVSCTFVCPFVFLRLEFRVSPFCFYCNCNYNWLELLLFFFTFAFRIGGSSTANFLPFHFEDFPLIINYYLIKSNRYDCYPIIRTTFQIPLKSQESEKKKISQTGTESTLEIHLSYEVIIDYLYKTTTTTNLLDHNHPRGTEEHEYTDRFTASYSLIHATREDNENRNQAILRYYPSARQDPRGNNSTRL